MRNPYAAEQLLSEVQAQHPGATWEPFGDPDGIDVQRTFRFDKDHSAAVKEVLEVIEDPRIESFENTPHGLVVTFSAKVNADERTDFGVERVSRVLEGGTVKEAKAAEPKPSETEPAAKAKAAKKDQ